MVTEAPLKSQESSALQLTSAQGEFPACRIDSEERETLELPFEDPLFRKEVPRVIATDTSRKKPFLKRTKQVSWARKVQGYAYQAS